MRELEVAKPAQMGRLRGGDPGEERGGKQKNLNLIYVPGLRTRKGENTWMFGSPSVSTVSGTAREVKPPGNFYVGEKEEEK